jgi:hypothetical protein
MPAFDPNCYFPVGDPVQGTYLWLSFLICQMEMTITQWINVDKVLEQCLRKGRYFIILVDSLEGSWKEKKIKAIDILLREVDDKEKQKIELHFQETVESSTGVVCILFPKIRSILK